MSDEEKKAIKKVKYICDKWYDENLEIDVKWLESLLSLCEKQSKEIEELKEYKQDAELTKVACCSAQNCEALNNCIKLTRELQNADKKWKDKIKAKIEYNKTFNDDIHKYTTLTLEELLEKE